MLTHRAKSYSHRANRTGGTFTRVEIAFRIPQLQIQDACRMWNLSGGDS